VMVLAPSYLRSVVYSIFSDSRELSVQDLGFKSPTKKVEWLLE
jgi:hypothetical protein